MAETATTPPSETAPAQTDKPEPASTPALSVEAIRDALLPEIEKRLKPAYDAARRAEAKAERAPEKFRGYLAPIEEAVEGLLTQNMTDDAKEAFRARRDLARSKPEVDPEAQFEQDKREFVDEANSFLAEEGIDGNDPVFQTTYQKLIGDAKTPVQWRKVLNKAVAATLKDRAAKLEASVGDREKKAREDERNKVLNERRESQGPLDRGGSRTSDQKKDWLSMSDEEFKKEEARKDQERLARRMGTR